MAIAILIEDRLSKRWNLFKKAVEKAKYEDFWPKTSDFCSELLKVSDWLPLLINNSDDIKVIIDVEIGQQDLGAKIHRSDVEAIIEEIKTYCLDNRLLTNYFFEKLKRELNDDKWRFKIFIIVCHLCQTKNIEIRNISALPEPFLKVFNRFVQTPLSVEDNVEDIYQFLISRSQQVQSPLEVLWQETNYDVHHSKEKALTALRKFLKIKDDEKWMPNQKFTDEDMDTLMWNCLKTICGETSYFHDKGDEHLSIMGTFLLLLGAIAWKNQSYHDELKDKIIIENNNADMVRRSSLVRHISKPIAIKSARILFDIFSLIVFFDETHDKTKKNKFIIKGIVLSNNQITITLDFPSETLINKSNIALHYFYFKYKEKENDEKNQISLPLEITEQVGCLSKLIAEYALLNVGQNNNIEFPKKFSGIEVVPSDDKTKTILRIKKC